MIAARLPVGDLDLSLAGAQAVGMVGRGTDEVELRVISYQGGAGEMGVLRVQVGSFADPPTHPLWFHACAAPTQAGVVAVDLPEGRRYPSMQDGPTDASASRLPGIYGGPSIPTVYQPRDDSAGAFVGSPNMTDPGHEAKLLIL